MKPLQPATLVAGLGFLLAACVPGEALPSNCGAPAVTLPATLANDRLDPTNLEVCKGQRVMLQVTSQRAGEFHLHGYEAEVPESQMTPGQTMTLTFDAVRSGQFPIELHPADGSDEVEIGSFTVHEP